MDSDQSRADRNVGDDMSVAGQSNPLEHPTRNFLTWGEVYPFQESLSSMIIAGTLVGDENCARKS